MLELAVVPEISGVLIKAIFRKLLKESLPGQAIYKCFCFFILTPAIAEKHFDVTPDEREKRGICLSSYGGSSN
ncbi:MAG TPA: hypothetical protein DCG57_14330 [Candidatus Riflebacteria bacterium]|nr:hypothetical protein [Candidatus Riflebacteria bacterium]